MLAFASTMSAAASGCSLVTVASATALLVMVSGASLSSVGVLAASSLAVARGTWVQGSAGVLGVGCWGYDGSLVLSKCTWQPSWDNLH